MAQIVNLITQEILDQMSTEEVPNDEETISEEESFQGAEWLLEDNAESLNQAVANLRKSRFKKAK